MSALALEAVTKRFGGVVAADALTMTIPPGQVTGLIGPNGAGKTTVVNLITGMLALTAGRIALGTRDLTHAPAHEIGRAGIARTFQNIRLLPEASVLDNVMIGFHRH
jgi:branched-chain amino acid transport system ATP-binding protein